MSSEWQKLKENREAILMAAVGALLHDVGKCTSEFAYLVEARSSDKHDPYKAIFRKDELEAYAFSEERMQERLEEAGQQYALHTLLSAGTLRKLDASFTVDGFSYTLREAIYFTRPRFAGNIGRALKRPGEPLDLLAYCHRVGHVEKEEPFPPAAPYRVARYSPFGEQLDQIPEPSKVRSFIGPLDAFDWEGLMRAQRTDELRRLFDQALGDTRFPINEVTLWDWSYSVASLFKSELARHYVANVWRRREDLRWRLLRVNFDVLGLYTKAIKIGDLLGYKAKVDEACRAVKRMVEEEYPLGNEVYRDTTGIYFTFPDLDLPAELRDEIAERVRSVEPELAPRIRVGSTQGRTAVEQLKRLLVEQRTAARTELAQPVATENLDLRWQQRWEELADGRREVCPVCRLRPMREGAEACRDCSQRRGSRVETWKTYPRQTIWMDEIADHNGRVALIVGRFGLDDWLSGDLVQTLMVRAVEHSPDQCRSKNPSPARLRRVWETTQQFWERTAGDILARIPDRKRWELVTDSVLEQGVPPEGAVCDGTLNGQSVSVIRIGTRLLTISHTPQLRPGRLRVSWAEVARKCQASLSVSEVRRVEGELASYSDYSPTLRLVASPDEFLALVPAGEAVDVLEEVRQAYAREFGKVQDRLPLFLGLVFFQRKTPLVAAMDTARRMLGEPMLTEESWAVRGITCEQIEFENGITWHVPTKMGDGKTEDVWYPYLFLEGSTPARRLGVQLKEDKYTGSDKYKNRWLVHVKDLRRGDRVRVAPSRFAYCYLEHSAQRFRFDPNTDVMGLDELTRLVLMWKNVCASPEMTGTKLRAVWAVLESKRREWGMGDGPDHTLRHLVETAFKREKIAGVSADDVLSGRFGRCLDLYLCILKRKVDECGEEN